MRRHPCAARPCPVSAGWEDRAALRALDIAVSPGGPSSPADRAAVLATTEQGMVRSTDGGRTFGGPVRDV
ncbi:hypothetical protein ACFU5W_31125, partial [Streptomyces laurentii]